MPAPRNPKFSNPMARLGKLVWQGIKAYYWPSSTSKAVAPELEPVTEDSVGDAALFVTGNELIARVYEAIRTRRSVLITGPRGCGKSFCAERGIRAARDGAVLDDVKLQAGIIGGWRFLQGNREIPRDLLSEDMLIIGDQGSPETLRALAMRPLENAKPLPSGLPADLRKDWPAIRSSSITKTDDPRLLWRDSDWIVLYLDEINRFGDGFLDSLLSLTEEGKIVRRGEDYYLPMVLIATANPPGYDATAKKLSPPLQARISRSYRVSQPPIAALAGIIVADKVAQLTVQYESAIPPKQFHLDLRLQWLAAGITLCLWGDPSAGGNGMAYLTKDTREALSTAMALDTALARSMRQLSTLLTFGPDSRAVGDWISAAVGLAIRETSALPRVTNQHLLDSAVEVLGHKVRDNFNEGAEPGKVKIKEFCILEVVRIVLENPRVSAHFLPGVRGAAAALLGATSDSAIEAAEQEIQVRFDQLPPDRQRAWKLALVNAPSSAEGLAKWRKEAGETGALSAKGMFVSAFERQWLLNLIKAARHTAAIGFWTALNDWPIDTSSLLHPLLTQRSAIAQFAVPLQEVFNKYGKHCLIDDVDTRVWIDVVGAMIEADRVTDSEKDLVLWRAENHILCGEGRDRATDLEQLRPRKAVLDLLSQTFVAIERFSNKVGKRRCARVQSRISLLSTANYEAAAMTLLRLAARNLTEPRYAWLVLTLRRECQRLFEQLYLVRPNEAATFTIRWLTALELSDKSGAATPGDAPVTSLSNFVSTLMSSAKAVEAVTPYGFFNTEWERNWIARLVILASKFAQAWQPTDISSQLHHIRSTPISPRWLVQELIERTGLKARAPGQAGDVVAAMVGVLEKQGDGLKQLLGLLAKPREAAVAGLSLLTEEVYDNAPVLENTAILRRLIDSAVLLIRPGHLSDDWAVVTQLVVDHASAANKIASSDRQMLADWAATWLTQIAAKLPQFIRSASSVGVDPIKMFRELSYAAINLKPVFGAAAGEKALELLTIAEGLAALPLVRRYSVPVKATLVQSGVAIGGDFRSASEQQFLLGIFTQANKEIAQAIGSLGVDTRGLIELLTSENVARRTLTEIVNLHPELLVGPVEPTLALICRFVEELSRKDSDEFSLLDRYTTQLIEAGLMHARAILRSVTNILKDVPVSVLV